MEALEMQIYQLVNISDVRRLYWGGKFGGILSLLLAKWGQNAQLHGSYVSLQLAIIR